MSTDVYRNHAHMDQYHNLISHYLLNHMLGADSAIYTQYDRCNIVTEEAGVSKKISHVNSALGNCTYPSCSFKGVREQIDLQELNKNQNRI